MNIEQKFIDAVERALKDKKAKNIYELAINSGVDQGGLSVYIRTKRALSGNGDMPARPKNNLHLSMAGKVIDYLGGSLIFPWDSPEASCRHELEKTKKLLKVQERELIELKAQNSALMKLISDRLNQSSIMPENVRQNKDCA